jgi:transposase-like protein
MGEDLARLRLPRSRGTKVEDGFTEVWVPMSELNPKEKPFERVVFHAWRLVGNDRVQLDRVGLTRAPPMAKRPSRSTAFTVDCRGPSRGISPLIYGLGGADGTAWSTGATARRWGGNPTTRYNWQLNTWNVGNDWFFMNRGARGSAYEDFLEENRKHAARSAVTVPIMGWVAKDGESYSFPISVFGPQQAHASNLPDAGNGIGKDGKPIVAGPATRTSVRSTPELIERWVRQIREKDGAGRHSVHQYILDNEPMLWNKTHRDVHPDPTTYDELLEKTLAYAAAIRRADPDATIAGPASWGWLAYHYSAKDAAAGVFARPDRRAHGDVPLIPWYLRKIREQEQKTGTRLLDLVDVHFYPQGQGIGEGKGGNTDPATNALRIRSTRSLWDPTYKDESWIDERMRVLPLLRQWVEENRPGLGISIGEWNFGAEGHMSGGLAVAEALGRFGTEGVHSAYYWTSPAEKTPAYWAFRAYRDFDGKGGRFLDRSIPAKWSDPLASLFASQDLEGKRVVLVLLNLDPVVPLKARIAVQGCASQVSARALSYAGGEGGFQPLELDPSGRPLEVAVAPYSITILALQLAPAAP